jgi:hypothetical protein
MLRCPQSPSCKDPGCPVKVLFLGTLLQKRLVSRQRNTTHVIAGTRLPPAVEEGTNSFPFTDNSTATFVLQVVVSLLYSLRVGDASKRKFDSSDCDTLRAFLRGDRYLLRLALLDKRDWSTAICYCNLLTELPLLG